MATEIAQRIIKEDWSARKVEQVVALWRQEQTAPTPQQPAPAAMAERPYAEVTKQLAGRYHTEVKIRTNTRGAGQIILPFKDAEDFQRLKDLLAS